MGRTRAIMLTMTTYGTWLRGDRLGWVEDGRILPANPDLEAADRGRLKHPPFLFAPNQLSAVGEAIGRALTDRLLLAVLALTVQTWHVHVVVGATEHDVAQVVKCAKDAARYALRPRRPIWSDGYDKQFCFDADTVRSRVQYVERHNVRMGWPPRPWKFMGAGDAPSAP